MVLVWRSVLPFVLISALIFFEDWVSVPSCKVVPRVDGEEDSKDLDRKSEDELKVMLVADLLLLGSDAGFFNLYFREYYMSKFFKKSFHNVKPDLLLVMGDVSAKGAELTRTEWASVINQLQWILGPFLEIPFHVTLGDRDVGECSELDARSVRRIANRFPHLSSAGCSAFEINNVSFVSLNAVALLCGDNALRFGVEREIERESIDVRRQRESPSKLANLSGELKDAGHKSGRRENAVSSGSGPVVLLHFPLDQLSKDSYLRDIAFNGAISCSSCVPSMKHKRVFADQEPYDVSQTVPPNATEYIFQALKPRIVFSGHTHEFSDHTHTDGTRAITVPAMTWKAKNNPGFVVATFRTNASVVSISYCSLAMESHVLMAYGSFLVILLTLIIVGNKTRSRCSKQ